MNIKQVRKDTPGAGEVIHFNNAGASLPTKFVNNAIKKWLDEEEMTGGYEMESKYESEIMGLYAEIAKLIHCSKDEIAITDNASTAFSKALYAIPFKAEDEIITSEIEYSSNYLNYLKLKKDKGIKLTLIPTDEEGPVDVEALKKAINKKTKLIAITHMPTSSGAIAPVKEIGKIAKQNNIIYMVDTCQSIGHYPTFVDEIQCDFLNGTSRKYLRGPRGLGFLYARRSIYEKLDPYMLEAMGAEWNGRDNYDLNYTSKMFECFEKPVGFMMGLKAAIHYANELTIEHIWTRIDELASYARERWSRIKGVQLHDGNGKELSGIITLTLKDQSPQKVQELLSKHGINSSLCKPFTSYTDMKNKGLASSNRLSLHYYNTLEEIERVADKLQNIR
ncbi:aminotransferase class V-fold PLP-dependent enzyme [Portibacter marinus]|uniref:aminotransferase class V-fold PLP-dependent enzyme n=1 Tax=Portibacter marinus TaxID=2898660 RepID=UPI001F1C4078|nr:aminotransferase class V-fold PLP-dependent enzyme [Portibacter marinus]